MIEICTIALKIKSNLIISNSKFIKIWLMEILKYKIKIGSIINRWNKIFIIKCISLWIKFIKTTITII